MGKNLQNELWACPVAGLLHYFLDCARKMGEKKVFFSHFGQLLQCNFFRVIQGMPSETLRPGLSENVVVFVAIIFLTVVLAAQSQRSLKF